VPNQAPIPANSLNGTYCEGLCCTPYILETRVLAAHSGTDLTSRWVGTEKFYPYGFRVTYSNGTITKTIVGAVRKNGAFEYMGTMPQTDPVLYAGCDGSDPGPHDLVMQVDTPHNTGVLFDCGPQKVFNSPCFLGTLHTLNIYPFWNYNGNKLCFQEIRLTFLPGNVDDDSDFVQAFPVGNPDYCTGPGTDAYQMVAPRHIATYQVTDFPSTSPGSHCGGHLDVCIRLPFVPL
jgi:hypothetical protein